MKNRISKVLIPCMALGAILAAQSTVAQDAALVVSGKVLLSGKKATDVKITVYQDNKVINAMTTKKNSFDLNLPMNYGYTIMVQKEGFEPYSAHIDATSGKVIADDFKLAMEVNLQVASEDTSPHFADYPNALIRFNERTEEFIYSEHYASHILDKKNPLQAATVE